MWSIFFKAVFFIIFVCHVFLGHVLPKINGEGTNLNYIDYIAFFIYACFIFHYEYTKSSLKKVLSAVVNALISKLKSLINNFKK